ncbi:MAG: hypothetical protein EOM12_13420 [Verrucomicrobiae bacterium]|nr:hypothetical protein [Verrucomicrobiae bacterium]
MKDLYNNIKVESVLDPIAVTATATYTDIDLQGYNSACLLIATGLDAETLGASHKFVFTLKDSDDGTTYAVVETKDMLNLTVASGVILTIDHADEDNTLYKFGYVGGKRYLELVCTVTGTVNMPISIVAVKGHPEIAAV